MSETPILDTLDAYFRNAMKYEQAIKQLRQLHCPESIVLRIRKTPESVSAARRAAVKVRWDRVRAQENQNATT